MAKATSKDKGVTARPRAPRASVSTPADPAGDAMDEVPRQQGLALARNDDAGTSDAASAADAEAAEDEDDESLRLDPNLYAPAPYDASASQVPTTRPPARTLTVPEPLMRIAVTRFLAESVIELLKVTWPTRREAWNMTMVVIALSALVALVLGVADLGLAHFLSWVVSLGQ